ncbi:MAG: hypothetical protein HYY96_00760 [Candidatus Tectomicrobia bacterium]|nr:hypothetical protein [Candidatus Tectomicrobia bacterium]
MKICVLGGGGTLGSAAAYTLAEHELAEEIVLLDTSENLARCHAIDINHAMAWHSTTQVRVGGQADLAGAGIVLCCAGAPRVAAASRLQYLNAGAAIIRELVADLDRYCPDAVIITATNPIDTMNALLHRHSRRPRERLLGYNRNDTSRFRWLVARDFGVPVTEVEAFVMGEHGDSQVPIFSRVRINGKPLEISPEQKDSMRAGIDYFWREWQELRVPRTPGWTSAQGFRDLVEAIVTDSGRLQPASINLEGEYGHTGISIGVPCRLGAGGMKEVARWELAPDERAAFDASVEKMREVLASLEEGS